MTTNSTILPRDSELFRRLHAAASERRCVFFAGLPGVGKSLLVQQLALIAGESGRRVHLLQWDVSRGPFETPEILGRYPEVDGVTHAAIRKAVGLWARDAVQAWHERHSERHHLLVGEVPLIGNRLIELVQRQRDAVEALLAGPETLFLIPVPSREVRRTIESARAREMADPMHDRERANAVPTLVQALWEEVATVGRALGVRGGEDASAFDPDLYAGVYARLLQHRHAERLDVTVTLPVQASVYDALQGIPDLVPAPDEVATIIARVGARPESDVEREVAGWFRV